ncbi:MAG: hypothetical protein ACJA09_003701 [Alcanivorax sp.]|jgi:hypothetical protein
MLSTDFMATQVKQILYSSVGPQVPVNLPNCLESSHQPLSHPPRLIRMLSVVFGILKITVDAIRRHFSVSNTSTL